jgi:hypothetical protein
LLAADRVEAARQQARDIERFCYRLVGGMETDEEIKKARGVLRLAVGLRRKLEAWEVR